MTPLPEPERNIGNTPTVVDISRNQLKILVTNFIRQKYNLRPEVYDVDVTWPFEVEVRVKIKRKIGK